MAPPIRARDTGLSELVRQRILDAILTGELRPGQLIQTGQLAQRYEVSRTPVREALAALERDGLVTVLPYRGYLVRSITVEEARDICFIPPAHRRRLREPRLAEALDGLFRDVRRLQSLSVNSPSPEQIQQEHVEIHAALRSRDPARARAAMDCHIRSLCRLTIQTPLD